MGDSKRRLKFLRAKDGSVTIASNIDHRPLTPEDYDLIINAVGRALRMKNLEDHAVWRNKEELLAGDFVTNKNGAEVEIDQLVYQLEQHRLKLGITRKKLAETLFLGEAEFNGIFRGKHRARLDIVRPLALLLGMRIVLVPNHLYKTIMKWVSDWENKKFSEYDEPFEYEEEEDDGQSPSQPGA